MSVFVLNRKYELALPTGYVDVDNEEMEYVDGGVRHTTKWWGNEFRFSKSETDKLIRMLTWVAGISTLAAEFGIPTIVAAVLGVGAVYVDGINYLGGDRGVTLKQNWLGQVWIDYNR